MIAEKKEIGLKVLSAEVLLATIAIIAALLFAWIAREAVFEQEKSVDNAVFSFFGSITTPRLILMMQVITFFGSTAFLVPAYLILTGYYYVKKQFVMVVAIVTMAVTCNLLYGGLKLIFKRHRPDGPLISGVIDYSFPSGHSLSAFIFYSILIYIVWRMKPKPLFKWGIGVLLFAFGISIGISRIVLRVHYPTDVLASFCLGTVWVIIAFWLLERFKGRAGGVL